MDTSGLPTRFHRKKAIQQFRKSLFATKQASKVVYNNPEREGLIEKTDDEVPTQDAIRQIVDLGSASKQFELNLKSGPYSIDYSRNGRYLALCGKRGHVAAFDWMTKRLLFETNVNENCSDVKFLHQETFIAVAQKGYTYIYDNQGIELHCLKRMSGIVRLEFLPFHFILAGMASNGFIYYLDSSIGEILASYPTHMGALNVACQNPSNGAILTGHPSGAVSMWIPTEKTPVVKLLCHNSAVRSMAVHRSGMYLATSGLDRYLKIWDLRSTYNCLSETSLPAPAYSLDYSQTGMLALGSSTTVQILKDPSGSFGGAEAPHVNVEQSLVQRRVLQSAYLTHNSRRPVHRLRFCPYEDILGVGTAAGFQSLLCPGSGEPNYDALEENPFANRRHRQEREVKRLLDKIPYTMISIDSMLSKVRREDIADEWERKKNALLGELPKMQVPKVRRNKQKGGSRAGKIEQKKQIVRFNRKQFEVSNMLREKHIRPEKIKKIEEGVLPSDALVNKNRSKRRLKSALDVLIPKKN